MSVAVGVVLVVLCGAFVAAPFFRRGGVGFDEETVAPSRWERQKLDAYAAIKEAEFDYQTAKLSDADFAALRDKYAAQAVEAIAALDASKATRQRTGKHAAAVNYCPTCGRKAPAQAKFCPGCGRGLGAET